MSAVDLLLSEKRHLGDLLEAIQRCTYFLDASICALAWPLNGENLALRKKENDLFEALAAINERFAKLQDTLGAAMRHSLLLSGERADSFLKVLAIFEKNGVIHSVEDWQVARTARNLAAHDYEISYDNIAEHFNALHSLKDALYQTARRFVNYCAADLSVLPATPDFSTEFFLITV